MTTIGIRGGNRSGWAILFTGMAFFLLSILVGLAAADTEGPDAPLPTAADVSEAIETTPPGSVQHELTDPSAAEGVALHDLGREEALELLTGVFDQQVEAPAGIYDELQGAELMSPNVAVVSQGSIGQQAAEEGGEEEASKEGESADHPPSSPAELSNSTLVDSSVPLQASAEASEPINLSLTETGGHLEPAEPLVETTIPDELGEGVKLPGAGIGIALAGAPAEREPTVTGGSVAFYPNVAADTDLAVSPTPSGVETLSQLRTADAPTEETYDLSLPPGAQLVASEDGGAQVRSGGKTLMSVQPPSAIDAAGEPVPVELEVMGNAVKLHVSPQADTQFPVLLDPLFQTYEWAAKGTNKGICSSSFGTTPPGDCQHQEEWAYEVVEYPWGGLPHLSVANGWGPAQPGIFVHAEGQQRSGDHAAVIYTVPRYFKESPAPTSYIKGMKLSDVTWQALGQYASPYLFMGIWDSTAPGWVSYYSHTGQTEHGLNDTSYVYEFPNSAPDTHAKVASVGITDTEASASSNASVYVGAATVELGDNNAPSSPIPVPQSQWVNQSAPALEFTASDTGLGVYAMTAATEEVGSSGQPLHSWKASNGCIGVGNSACPVTWKSSEPGHQALTYEPSVLSTGIDYVSLAGEDPVGNKSATSWAQVRVDHQAPALALSGSLTEQATLGTKLTSYTLGYAATDGDEATPAATTPIGTTGTGTGQMERPFGVAVDKAGNVWVVDRENNCVEEYGPAGSLIRQFGSKYGAPGSGNGQFSDPRGIAISSAGNVWVTDLANKRVQEFNEKGEFIRSVTYAGGLLGQGKMAEPYAVATGPEETLWVGDVGSHRVYQFKENGTFVKAISAAGSVNLTTPAGIAVDRFGNAYVAEQSSSQIAELDSSGNYLNKFGTAGTGQGQLSGPVGVAIAASGNLLVADANNNRIEEFKPSGYYMRTFAAVGSEAGQLKEPRGIAAGPENTLYVADAGNHRIAKWNHADLDPQSGAAKVEVKVDGTTAKSENPGCANKNCAISGTWTMNANSYPGGPHKVEIIATDGVGITTTKTLEVETHGDDVAPQVALSGTMTEQATKGNTLPSYKLKVSATDPGSAEERKSGVASITTKVDGTTVDSTSPGCPNEGCSLTREWTLTSSNYSAGNHSVEVITTDAAGHSTTKTLTITLERDTTAPTLNTEADELVTAPEGWVEQERYFYLDQASDTNGYGVTSLQLKIDGKAIATSSGTCSAGSCTKTLFGEINMATYSGGAHPAELIATDGAGNVKKRTWTVNVDPEGHVTLGEAEDTLEAAEATGSTEVLQGEEPLKLEAGKEGLTAVGGEMPTTVGTTTNSGVGLETLEGEAFSGEEETEGEGALVPITIKPTGESTAEVKVGPEDETGIAANTTGHTDTVIRPVYDGIMTFQTIRDNSAPETYSWTVNLEGGETLKLESPQYAEVYYPGGHPAFGISAQPASDAVGSAVPTELSVSEGNVVTLTVKHRSASFVYPVVAGAGWEGGFVSKEIPGPKDEKELREEREQREREEQEALEHGEVGLEEEAYWAKQLPNGSWMIAEGGAITVGPPEYQGQGEATASFTERAIISRPFKSPACWKIQLGPAVPKHPNEEAGECMITQNLMARGWVHGHFHYEIEPGKRVWWDGGREGEIKCNNDFLHNIEWRMWPKECHFSGENFQEGAGSHIVAKHFWRVETDNALLNDFSYEVICLPMYIDLYQTGKVPKKSKWWGGPGAVRFVEFGEACPWPE